MAPVNYKHRMSTKADPRKQIQKLGEMGVEVQVHDPETGVSRSIRVNPFDRGSQWKGQGAIVEVCKSIQNEVNSPLKNNIPKSISKPGPAVVPDIGVSKERGGEIPFQNR